MEGGWPDQTRRDDSRCSPSILQASWDVWDTWNSLLDISREVGNTKNTTFYHFIDQKCGDSGEEKWITVQACQSILQCSRGGWILQPDHKMSFLCLELKQVACTKTENSVLAAGRKTAKFAYSKPTKNQKVVQKVGIVSLEVPWEDPEERSWFGRMVEAGEHSNMVCVWDCTLSTFNCGWPVESSVYLHILSPCLNHSIKS